MSLLLHFWAFSGLVGGNEEHPTSLSQFLLLRFLINRNLNKFDKKMKLTYKRRSMYITIICSLVAIFLTAIIPFNAKAVAFPSIMDVDNAVKQKRKREILKKTGEQVQEEVNERKNQKEEEHLSLKEAQKVEIAELKIQSNDNQNSDAVDSKANNKLSKKQTLAVKSESVLESELEQYKSLKELSKSEDWTDVQFLEGLQDLINQTNSVAMLMLGDFYVKGIHVEKNIEKGLAWYIKARDTGYADAEKEVKKWEHIVYSVDLGNGEKMKMVRLNQGSFMMGSPESELGNSKSEDQHREVITERFYIGQYEVTQRQYNLVMRMNPSFFEGDDNPVENVSWFDAIKFCEKLTLLMEESGQLPKGYEVSLPTDIQWEYACRAGTETALNSGKDLNMKDESNFLDVLGWYSKNSDKGTHPVGEKKPNAWKIYDMHGNVSEWCLDSSSWNPLISSKKGSSRILRGGSWNDDAVFCRSAYRDNASAGHKNKKWGFRVVLTPAR